MQLSDFHFDLPAESIASQPLTKRADSRLMCVESSNLQHKRFYEIVDLLNPGDLLVFNDTKVIPARLYGQKPTGGRVEFLVERLLDTHRLLAQAKASKPLRIGDVITLLPYGQLQVVGRQQQFYELIQPTGESLLTLIEAIGHIPLPHYMGREAGVEDIARYQTVYAKHKGSVAAPTAGLHFDDGLLQQLREKQIDMGYLTLHIGAGTFAPVRTEKITDHHMHAEYIDVSETLCDQVKAARARGNRVVAVGTTSVRALETASQSGEIKPYQGDTRIFITPGYRFHCVDALITNFHLPQSTLLMLVCALGGHAQIMQAYALAVSEGYRFYSYGDSMYITNPNCTTPPSMI